MLGTQAGAVQGGRPLLGRRRYGRDGRKEGEKEERLMPGSRLVGGASLPRGRQEEEQLTGTRGWGLEAEALLPIPNLQPWTLVLMPCSHPGPPGPGNAGPEGVAWRSPGVRDRRV